MKKIICRALIIHLSINGMALILLQCRMTILAIWISSFMYVFLASFLLKPKNRNSYISMGAFFAVIFFLGILCGGSDDIGAEILNSLLNSAFGLLFSRLLNPGKEGLMFYVYTFLYSVFPTLLMLLGMFCRGGYDKIEKESYEKFGE